MKTSDTIRCASAIVVAAALGAGALTAAKAADIVQVMRHSTPTLPGYGTLMLEIWTDGTAVQVIGLDGEGQIVLAREGTLTEEATLEGTGAIEGRLPADQLDWVRGTELAYQRWRGRGLRTRDRDAGGIDCAGLGDGHDRGDRRRHHDGEALPCPASRRGARTHAYRRARGARCEESLQVAAGRARGPRADAGRGTAHARADRDDGARAASGSLGNTARPALNPPGQRGRNDGARGEIDRTLSSVDCEFADIARGVRIDEVPVPTAPMRGNEVMLKAQMRGNGGRAGRGVHSCRGRK